MRQNDRVGNIGRPPLTIVEVQPNAMIRKHFCAHGDLAQTNPRQDDGASHNQNKPEWRRVNNRMAEGLARRAVVIREKDNLDKSD